MSKGSGRRPQSVDSKTFANNWDNIFNKKEILDTKDSFGLPLEKKPRLTPEPDQERYHEAIKRMYREEERKNN